MAGRREYNGKGQTLSHPGKPCGPARSSEALGCMRLNLVYDEILASSCNPKAHSNESMNDKCIFLV